MPTRKDRSEISVGRVYKRNGVARRFDVRPSTHKEQNQAHRLMGLDCFAESKRRKGGILRTQPLNLDQGVEGACTGFGCAHVLAATPKPNGTMNNGAAQQIYYQARREDEWVGEAYDGSSVNGAMHAARTMGYISAWRWIETPAELQHALSYHGAVEAGSPWREGMWMPDANGFLHTTGADIGGHAYCISGYKPDRSRGADAIKYWIDNSWGPSWGLDGGCWITDTEAHDLWFGTWAEIALPVKNS